MSICRFCGLESEGQLFDQWVRPTFTDWDKLLPGDIICDTCAFWFDEASEKLMQRMSKDKPQRMRTYSHFIVNNEWIPLSKANKTEMVTLLLGNTFPELAVIAMSGQKHIAFRAIRNPPGSDAGWVQFEEQRIFVEPQALADILVLVETLYTVFSKGEIESGDYNAQRIMQFGIDRWQMLEAQVKPLRGKPIFLLALFLAQRSDDARGITPDGSDSTADDLAGYPAGIQEPLPDEHLGTVRGADSQRGLHQQPGEVRQLSLWEDER
jgi:hypothetical protein